MVVLLCGEMMIKITGGVFEIDSNGSLRIEKALVEYDDYLGEKPLGFVESIKIIMERNFPEFKWEAGNHYVADCIFSYTIFSLENE